MYKKHYSEIIFLILIILILTSCKKLSVRDIIVPKLTDLKENYIEIKSQDIQKFSHLLESFSTLGEFKMDYLARGFKMHYLTKGEGEPLILIHGYGASVFAWRNSIDELAKHFKVYVIDLKGFGLSDKPTDAEYKIPAFIADLSIFMDVVGIKKAHLAGNSLGGAIAWGMAYAFPEKVISIIPIDPAVYPFNFILEFKLIGTPILGPATLYLFPGLGTRLMLHKSIFYNTDKITKKMSKGYIAPTNDPKCRNALHQFMRVNNPDKYSGIDTILNQINIPTLIVWGENDEIIPVEQAYRMQKNILDSKLLIIPECGHCPNEEQPKVLNKAIIDFIKNIKTTNK